MGRINIGHKDHPRQDKKQSRLLEPEKIYVDRIVEVPVQVEKLVPYETERIVEVERIVEKIVNVEIEKLVYAEPIIEQNLELQQELEDLKNQLDYEGANLVKAREKHLTDAKRKESLMASLRKQKAQAVKSDLKLKLAITASVILPLLVLILK